MDDVIAGLRREAPEMFADLPVTAAYLFGSHARGEARPDSDVDIAVLAPDARPDDRLDLRLALMAKLSAVVGAVTDVIVLDEAPLTLTGRVIRDGVVLYSRDEPRRVEYESRTFREYADFSREEEELARHALRVMAGGH